MHYTVHDHTVAELIASRVNAEKEHLRLTSWEKNPDSKIVETDVTITKNYLTEAELKSLGGVVNAYLNLAKDRARCIFP